MSDLKRWLLTTIRHYSPLFATVRRYSHYSRLFAIRYSGFPDTLNNLDAPLALPVPLALLPLSSFFEPSSTLASRSVTFCFWRSPHLWQYLASSGQFSPQEEHNVFKIEGKQYGFHENVDRSRTPQPWFVRIIFSLNFCSDFFLFVAKFYFCSSFYFYNNLYFCSNF